MSNDHGYYGCAYRNIKTNHIVIAHRGTSGDIIFQNILTDINLALLHRIPEYIETTSILFSEEVRRKNPGATFSETGHSLGGVLAQLNGYRFRDTIEVVSFDNPGCGVLRNLYINPTEHERERKFTSYLSAPNACNTSVNQHVGKVYRIYIPHTDLDGRSLKSSSTFSVFTHSSIVAAIDYMKGSFKLVAAITPLVSMAKMVMDYDIRQHAMPNIILSFDENTGQPLLQRIVEEWPSSLDYWTTKFDVPNTDIFSLSYENIRSTNKVIHHNLRVERNLIFTNWNSHYTVREFVCPQLTAYPQNIRQHVSEYKEASLATFDLFYCYRDDDNDNNNVLRNQLVHSLNMDRRVSYYASNYTHVINSDANVAILWTSALTIGAFGILKYFPNVAFAGVGATFVVIQGAKLLSTYGIFGDNNNGRPENNNPALINHPVVHRP